MAKLSNDELIAAFKEMTLIELSDFVKLFEETFDVEAAAPAAVAEPAADAAEAPVEEVIATELAEATAAEDATDDSEVTDVPDDWNMINVPRPKPVR